MTAVPGDHEARPAGAPPTFAQVTARLRAAGCVWAQEEAALLIAAGGDLTGLVRRRVAGEPLEQVLGWAQLAGVRVRLAPGVFVPRQRSALLVRLAVDLLTGQPVGERPVVVDLCCGSGALGLAVATAAGPVELHAADVDPVATTCAAVNLAAVDGGVHRGDLYDALPDGLAGRVAVLVVNAPYVPTDAIADLPAEARDHEPTHALDGGADGVDLHRRVADGAARWLAPNGALVLETSRSQAAGTAAAVRAGGLVAEVVADDELGATAVVGRHG